MIPTLSELWPKGDPGPASHTQREGERKHEVLISTVSPSASHYVGVKYRDHAGVSAITYPKDVKENVGCRTQC